MKSSTRNLYTALSILPFIFFVAYIVSFFALFVDMFHNMHEFSADTHPFPFENFGTIMVCGILMAVITLTTLIIFIIHALNNKSLPDNERIIWVIVFVFAGMIGFPIYWFMRGIKYNPDQYQQAV